MVASLPLDSGRPAQVGHGPGHVADQPLIGYAPVGPGRGGGVVGARTGSLTEVEVGHQGQVAVGREVAGDLLGGVVVARHVVDDHHPAGGRAALRHGQVGLDRVSTVALDGHGLGLQVSDGHVVPSSGSVVVSSRGDQLVEALPLGRPLVTERLDACERVVESLQQVLVGFDGILQQQAAAGGVRVPQRNSERTRSRASMSSVSRTTRTSASEKPSSSWRSRIRVTRAMSVGR